MKLEAWGGLHFPPALGHAASMQGWGVQMRSPFASLKYSSISPPLPPPDDIHGSLCVGGGVWEWTSNIRQYRWGLGLRLNVCHKIWHNEKDLTGPNSEQRVFPDYTMRHDRRRKSEGARGEANWKACFTYSVSLGGLTRPRGWMKGPTFGAAPCRGSFFNNKKSKRGKIGFLSIRKMIQAKKKTRHFWGFKFFTSPIILSSKSRSPNRNQGGDTFDRGHLFADFDVWGMASDDSWKLWSLSDGMWQKERRRYLATNTLVQLLRV